MNQFKEKKLFFLVLVVVCLTGFLFAEKKGKEKENQKVKNDDILRYRVVVTATRTEQPSVELGSSTSVISAEELKKTGKITVCDALKNISGLDVLQYGGMGEVSSVLIRGSKSEHTLVMIDGIEMNDPISPGRSFNFAHLTVDNIERIEIVRGPQSPLYGSDAMGGVIHIITKKGLGKPRLSLSMEGGSYNTFRESVGFSGGTEIVDYCLGVSRFDTKGFSASHKKYGNMENDGYGNTSFSARFGVRPLNNLNVSFITSYIDAKNDIDLKEGEGGDDPNAINKTKHLLLGTQAVLSLFKGKWEQKLGISFNHIDRESRNDKDPSHPNDYSEGFYRGQIFKVDWQHNLNLHQINTITCGIEYEWEEGESEYSWESAWGPGNDIFPEKSVHNMGIYFQDGLKLWERLFVTMGVRFDDHSRFGNVSTYRFAPAYIFKNGTKLKATYGTGFKAPSLYQLYAPAGAWIPGGNVNLSPEKSTGWDIGVEQYLMNNSLTLGVTYFYNKFEDLIQFDWTNGYVNISQAETWGAELFLHYQVSRGLTVHGNYTYTKTRDNETGEKLIRRPDHKLNLNINCRLLKKVKTNIHFSYVGRRVDIYPYPERIEMDPYILINLFFSYDLKKNLQFFFRLDNLFNKDYEVVKGYGTAGRSFYLGFKTNF